MIIPKPAVKAVVVNCVFTSLAFLFVLFRVLTRTFILKNVGADDVLIILSVLASVAFLAVVMLQIKAGLGRQITFPELPAFLQALWATIPLYNLSLLLVKLSITTQCYRVLRTPKMQTFLRSYFVFLTIYGLWTLLSSVTNCWPVSYYWAFTQGVTGSCMNKAAITFSNAGMNIATDLVLIVVPVPLLWGLQIPRRQKIILMGLFGVGSIAVVMSIIRLQALYQIAIAPESEQSVQGVMIAIWSCVEINVAIMCASVPALKPLVVRFFPRLLLSEIYARSRGGRYARRSKGVDGSSEGGGSGTRSTTIKGGSGGHGHLAKGSVQIRVEREFEMRSLAVGSLGGGGMEVGRGNEDFKVSRDGSEKGLVGASWEEEYVASSKGPKKASIRSHPRDMV